MSQGSSGVQDGSIRDSIDEREIPDEHQEQNALLMQNQQEQVTKKAYTVLLKRRDQYIPLD